MVRTLGIDIGIASIGWAVIEGEYTQNGLENKRIIDSGVRIFTKAENPKNRESLALPRRLARSARRRNARRRARMNRVKTYLSKVMGLDPECFLQEGKLASFFQTSPDFISPWELRERGLCRVLNKEELARVILHIAKRRGYDDITYGLDNSKEGVIKKAISHNAELIRQGGCRTVGEMMYKNYYQHSLSVRNKKGSYNQCIGRSELREELGIILATQQELGNPYVSQDFIEKLLGRPDSKSNQERDGLIFYQRPLKGFGDKIGYCRHIQIGKESPRRACKNAPSAEEFVALTKIINFLMYLKNHYGDVSFSLKESIQKILQEAQKNKNGLTYSKLKLILGLPSDFEFDSSAYNTDSPKTDIFISLPSTFSLNKIVQNREIQDEIAEILGANKDWDLIGKELNRLDLSQEQIQAIKDANFRFSKHINLSIKALNHILPLMREGMRYDEAVETLQEQGIFSKPQPHQQNALPPLSKIVKENSYFDISNPVLKRALSEFRKVVNAILEKHGGFHYFNIELAREICNGKEYRNQLEKINQENKKENDQARKLLEKLGLSDTYKNRLKCKLWMQQNEVCLYSGEKIPFEALKDDSLLQIDHVLPLSQSLDDSQSNKILCLTSSNQNKLNQTPYEWFGSNEELWNAYVNRVYKTKFSKGKKRKLTQKSTKIRNANEFIERNIVDTGYIGRVVKEYVKLFLSFLPLPDGKKEHIRIISGSMTSTMRNFWGIGEKDRTHHLHHAQDAIVIACIQPSMIQKYINYLKEKETHYLKSAQKAHLLNKAEYKTKLALRWPFDDFKNKVEESIKSIIVSHRVSHKVTGALHEETVQKRESCYKTFGGEEGVKKALEFGKIREVNHGIVNNGAMVRVDIFKNKNKGGFYAVPVYTYDFAVGKLPNKAIVQGKKDGMIRDWIEMDEHYEFCFSLFKNDCIKIQTKDMQEPIFVIYKATSSSTASINLEHLSKYAFASLDEEKFFAGKDKNTTMTKSGCGIQTLKVFQKVKLTLLGEIKECKQAARQSITIKR